MLKILQYRYLGANIGFLSKGGRNIGRINNIARNYVNILDKLFLVCLIYNMFNIYTE